MTVAHETAIAALLLSLGSLAVTRYVGCGPDIEMKALVLHLLLMELTIVKFIDKLLRMCHQNLLLQHMTI